MILPDDAPSGGCLCKQKDSGKVAVNQKVQCSVYKYEKVPETCQLTEVAEQVTGLGSRNTARPIANGGSE